MLFKIWLFIKKIFILKTYTKMLTKLLYSLSMLSAGMYEQYQFSISSGCQYIPRKHSICTYTNQKRNAKRLNNIKKHK
jgi:hypothetical protein